MSYKFTIGIIVCDKDFKYIEKLRKLVDGVFTDKVSDTLWPAVFILFLTADDTGVVVHFEHHAAVDLIFFHKLLFAFFSVHVHTSEFIHLKGFAVPTNTILREENRTGRFDINGGGKENKNNKCNYTAEETADDICNSL